MGDKILKASLKDSLKEVKGYGKEISKLVKGFKKRDKDPQVYKRLIAEADELKNKWSNSFNKFWGVYDTLYKNPTSSATKKTVGKTKKK